MSSQPGNNYGNNYGNNAAPSYGGAQARHEMSYLCAGASASNPLQFWALTQPFGIPRLWLVERDQAS